MFIEILHHLNDGVGVSIVPTNAELTTQQAADMLGASRPYFFDKILMPAGPMPYRAIGRHRRIRFSDLDSYRRNDGLRKKAAADKVSDHAVDAGLGGRSAFLVLYGNADAITTNDLGFDAAVLAPHNLVAQTPDDSCTDLLDISSPATRSGGR